ncbi:Transcriptional regulatory protein DegU [Mariniflexile rhizosphaerae]|uniref:response regulator n=1 Tax=unclassified Mariniflexile TaxID=2643887 RepID=UPI000CB06676|nr:response regulator transcription factor [Mariniflexile sp. TRM1-10]AXP82238.1 Transcriptional regulatory protein DegU [Mariniflexile sp. TRM1-10]PLB19197.1 MAG: Two component transcriptional regulator, LuxR family [Flavobacteriaceae bacterium FS1-H7996/R]
MTKPCNTVIVDDHSLFAEGLKRILEDDLNFRLTAIYNIAEDALHAFNNSPPELVLLDIQLPGMGGLEFCRQMKERYPEMKVVMISMFESTSIISDAKASHANGYIPKTTDAQLFKTTLYDIIKGNNVFLSKSSFKAPTTNQPQYISLLSKRELDIITYIKQGHTSKEIAEQLFISQFTVDTHRKNILKKLQLPSVKALIAFAHENHI